MPFGVSSERTVGRRWAYLGAGLGGAVSIAANVAHSYVPPTHAAPGWRPNDGAVIGAVFWPTALFVAVEVLARVPWPRGARWVAVRYLGLLPVAVVAAVVSYRHMALLMAWYGEEPLTAWSGPLAVDGLMVMSAGALIGTGQRRAVASGMAGIEPATSAIDSGALPTELHPAPAAAGSEPTITPASDSEPVMPSDVPVRVSPELSAKIAKAYERNPDATQVLIAKKAGASQRTVARWQAEQRATTPNGKVTS